MSEPCSYRLHPETFNPPQPAEYCSEPAEPGYDVCLDHMPYMDASDLEDLDYYVYWDRENGCYD